MSSPASGLLDYALISTDDLIEWAAPANQNPATILPFCNEIINGLSQAVYWLCGRTPPMLTEPTSFTETYNGSGSDVLYLLNAPITAVSSLTLNGVSFPASSAYGQAGYFVQQDGKSIALRSGATSGYPFPFSYGWQRQGYCFSRGRGNVVVSYTAGYEECPSDIYLAVVKQATVLLNKRLREDIGSKIIPNTGTDSYRAWAMQPEVMQMLQPYRRIAMVNIFR